MLKRHLDLKVAPLVGLIVGFMIFPAISSDANWIAQECQKSFYGLSKNHAQKRKMFLAHARALIDHLTAIKKDNLSFKTISGKKFSLQNLRDQIGTICALETQNIFGNAHYGKDITCSSVYDGQWLTKKDSGLNHPLIGLKYVGMGDSDGGDAALSLLYLHESLGALGYTDDEYQISASLMSLATLSNWDSTLAKILLAQLEKLETHDSAPTYDVSRTEGCYKWVRNKEGFPFRGDLIKDQNLKLAHGTHVGGGGDPHSLMLKAAVITGSEAYWKKHKIADDYETFVKRVLETGIESLDEFASAGKVIFPIQIHVGKSKRKYPSRERKAAFYLYSEDIMRDALSRQAAVDLILDQIYCVGIHKQKGCKSLLKEQNLNWKKWGSQRLP